MNTYKHKLTALALFWVLLGSLAATATSVWTVPLRLGVASGGGVGPLPPKFLTSGGGGGVIVPPKFGPPPNAIPAANSSLLVESLGATEAPWTIVVRTSWGMPVLLTSTSEFGDAQLSLPPFGGLMLDVIGTEAVDVPIAAGQRIFVLVD